MGVVLAAAAIILISFGFNNLNRWGLGVARPGAPFDLLGLSPAPVMIVIGIVLLQAFIVWTRRQQAAGKTPLLDLRVITSGQERAAVFALFAVVALEAMLNFSVPLYIQIIQGRTPIETAIAMLPFNLTVFFTAMLVVRLYDKVTPRRIGQLGFVICTVALLWLAWVVRNDWSAPVVMIGLIVFGIGQGALVTLLFNVLVTAAPKELAGDVGSLRGTTQNLAAAVGTAVAGALLVGLLSSMIMYRLADNPEAADRAPGAARSRQHQLRHQRPAARDHAGHDGDARAGRGGGAHQHRIAPARAQDRPPDHGGRGTGRDLPGQPPAGLQARRDPARPLRDA